MAYKRKPSRKPVTVRREEDHNLASMILDLQPVSEDEIEQLHSGVNDKVSADDLFYGILRRLIHLGMIYESELYGAMRINQHTWQRLKKEHPELEVRLEQYLSERDLVLQAYKNNILFNPDHPDHVTMLRDHDKQRAARELYKLRSEERKITRMLLEAQRLSQPKVQQLIAVMPAQQNQIATMSPQQLMDALAQPVETKQGELPSELQAQKEEA